MSKCFVKRPLIAGAGLLFVFIVVLGALWWYHAPFRPFMDDGPFQGAAVSPVVDQRPDQRFAIYNDFVLEVYDPSIEGESPIVQLRDATGQILWAIRADGHEIGDVQEVRFSRFSRGLSRTGTVWGSIRWTYGHEAAHWFITGDGKLRDYWYAW